MTVPSTSTRGKLSQIVDKMKSAAQCKNENDFKEHLSEWGHLYTEENAVKLAEKYFKLDADHAKIIFKEFNQED